MTLDKKLPSLSLRFLNLWTHDNNDCLTLVARFIESVTMNWTFPSSSGFFEKEHWTPNSHLCFPFQRKRSQLPYLILNTRKTWQRTRRSYWLPCALWPKERSSWWRRTLLWRTSLPSRWLLSESATCSWQASCRSEGGHQRLGICAFSSSFSSQGWGQVVWMEGGGYNDRSQWCSR